MVCQRLEFIYVYDVLNSYDPVSENSLYEWDVNFDHDYFEIKVTV